MAAVVGGSPIRDSGCADLARTRHHSSPSAAGGTTRRTSAVARSRPWYCVSDSSYSRTQLSGRPGLRPRQNALSAGTAGRQRRSTEHARRTVGTTGMPGARNPPGGWHWYPRAGAALAEPAFTNPAFLGFLPSPSRAPFVVDASDDGRVVASGGFGETAPEGLVIVYDAIARTELGRMTAPHAFVSVDVSSDGRYVLAHNLFEVQLFDVASAASAKLPVPAPGAGDPAAVDEGETSIANALLRPGGEQFVVVTSDGVMTLWDLDGNQLDATLPGRAGRLRRLQKGSRRGLRQRRCRRHAADRRARRRRDEGDLVGHRPWRSGAHGVARGSRRGDPGDCGIHRWSTAGRVRARRRLVRLGPGDGRTAGRSRRPAGWVRAGSTSTRRRRRRWPPAWAEGESSSTT